MIIRDGAWFKDEYGRRLMLRGVNLGGSSKVPCRPDGATYRREGFFEHRTVSFVGRPFSLAEADEHFSRLRRWGLTFLRFLITWEAIEHAGPGQYDEAYLDYLREMVKRAGKHGFNLFIDPHQDVWSRFTGGDGAPGWTLEAVGFDMTQFKESGAAIVHATHGDPFPRMIWPTNGSKLAAATMFSLFFGGNDFSPATKVDGEPVQEYLQRHYCEAIRQAALRLNDLPNVIGYDTLNEPLAGYIGWRDLHSPGGTMTLGESPSPFQAMLLGAGIPQQVGVWEIGALSLKRTGTRLLNPQGKRAWREGFDCIWRQNGVWDCDSSGKPQLLRPGHFCQMEGREVDFGQDYYRPFANRFAETIRSTHPKAQIFIETEPGHMPPEWSEADAAEIVYAPHWYDGLLLVTKRFNSWLAINSHTRKAVLGSRAIRRSFAGQIALLKQWDRKRLGGTPVVLGEFGIPYDMNDKNSYSTGDFSQQAGALDRTFQAVEANLLNCTLWNYTADNTNARGDLWNDEDLSIFSRDQQQDLTDPYSGGRALEAVIRPYPRATAGEPLRLSFDYRRRRFEFHFRHDPDSQAPTEIFLPQFHYPRGCQVEVSDGAYEIRPEDQTLLYRHSLERQEHTIQIRPA